MAEAEAAAAGSGLSELAKRKIAGLPAIAWVGIAALVFWYVKKKQGSTTTGPQTDPAGNTGTIDPATGYAYGTAADQSALASQSAGTGLGTGTGTSGGSTVSGVYADNTAWASAAINYLVSIGVDAVSANSAITQYLASQALTTQQQGDVNLAIQRLGSPPSPPQPGTAPPPIVTPPGPGTVYATNPPTGLAVVPAGSTSLNVKWNRASNAQGYTIKWGTSSAASTGSTTVSGTAGSTTITGLKADTSYTVQVQATPAKAGDAFASARATTAKATSGGGGGTGKGKTTTVTVVAWNARNPAWNSTLSGIADHYHVSGGASELARLNGISNPDLIKPGQRIKVPVS